MPIIERKNIFCKIRFWLNFAPKPLWGDEEKDCENEKDGDDLMVNDEDLDEMYDMYVHIQPVEGNSNNNKRKLSEEDTQTPSQIRRT